MYMIKRVNEQFDPSEKRYMQKIGHHNTMLYKDNKIGPLFCLLVYVITENFYLK